MKLLIMKVIIKISACDLKIAVFHNLNIKSIRSHYILSLLADFKPIIS